MVEYRLKPIGEHVDIRWSMRISSQARVFSSNFPIHYKGLVVISIPVISLLVSTCLFSYVQWENDLAENRVKHTLEVKEHIQTIMKAALAVQSSVRTYMANGDDRSFSAYRNACKVFPELLTNLEKTVQDDETQSARAKRIRSLTD